MYLLSCVSFHVWNTTQETCSPPTHCNALSRMRDTFSRKEESCLSLKRTLPDANSPPTHWNALSQMRRTFSLPTQCNALSRMREPLPLPTLCNPLSRLRDSHIQQPRHHYRHAPYFGKNKHTQTGLFFWKGKKNTQIREPRHVEIIFTMHRLSSFLY